MIINQETDRWRERETDGKKGKRVFDRLQKMSLIPRDFKIFSSIL